MRPKGKLFALVVLFAAVGLLTATGAFTTVEADRTATVETAGDANALLAIEPGPDNPDYVDNSSGEIVFDITNGSEGNAQINLNATTEINGTINLTNNGESDVDIYIESEGENNGLVSFYTDSGDNITSSSASSSENISPGDTVTVSVIIDTKNADLSSEEELIDIITIVAEDTDEA